jgi:hypothetical protein
MKLNKIYLARSVMYGHNNTLGRLVLSEKKIVFSGKSPPESERY